MAEYPILLGVYSQNLETSVGQGDTAVKRETCTYWYARQLGQDCFDVQPLNIYHVPSGVKSELDARGFLSQYSPEPRYYTVYTVPALTSLAQKIAKGEEQFQKGQLDEAEKSFLKALMIDDVNVKANYGLGQVYTEKQDFAKLKKVLNTLLNIDEAFSLENREQFNRFGIDLRKKKLLDEAMKFYTRALELDAMDDHVHFNVARVHFEKENLDDCLQHLNIALAVNPEFSEALKFLTYCQNLEAARAAG